nr:TetR/AcrR family transcriptional regulator C-terminal domain-containing protein [Herbaspirillum sp. B39]
MAGRALPIFLKVKMDEGKLHAGDPWIAAMQFRALIEAEWMDVRMLNVVTENPRISCGLGGTGG